MGAYSLFTQILQLDYCVPNEIRNSYWLKITNIVFCFRILKENKIGNLPQGLFSKLSELKKLYV